MRQLGRNDPAPSPYKPTVSPLRSLSSIGSNPLCIHPDPAHTYAIHGWGKDLAAGALLCLIHLRLFWDRTLERSLNLAYEHFRDFCQATGKSTSIVRFDLKELKTDQASHGCRFTFYKCCMVWILVIVACTYLSRLKKIPSGLGKGHDCAVVLAWLEDVTSNTRANAVACCRC